MNINLKDAKTHMPAITYASEEAEATHVAKTGRVRKAAAPFKCVQDTFVRR